MKTTSLVKKLTLASLLTGTFFVFGGFYQGMKVSDTSYMNDKAIKFVKRLDEAKDRVVASTVKSNRAIHYVPVNDFNNALLNGKWEIIRIEDENSETVLDSSKGDKTQIVDLELVRTSQVKINNNNKYLFDISFLHERGQNIALFRAFGNGYELMELRKVVKASKFIAPASKIEEIKEEAVALEEGERVELKLERAMIPSLDNTVIMGDENISGEVSIGNNSVQGLSFNVRSKEGKEVNFSISDIELKDGGTFSVEVDGKESTGLVTNNGKDAYRVRFATGPFQGALLNFVSDAELERLREEAYEVERMKEDRSYEDSIQVSQVEEKQVEVSGERVKKQENVIDASYKERLSDEMRSEILEEMEEEYRAEQIEGEENITAEVQRQGFGF